ncbi:MAG: hypothetical protein P4L92_02800 [Rudaea sp.]|nr:hypothetical protein [Rudaea sp.]
MLKRFAIVATVVLLPCLGLADPPVEKRLTGQTLDAFDQEAVTVRQGMQPGGVYEYMKTQDKTRVEAGLDQMHKLLQDHAAPGGLSPQDKIVLLNTQEQVNALLLHNDNNRLICENRAPTGSRIHQTTCNTHGELMARQEHDQRALGDVQKQPQTQRSGQ